MTLFLLLLVFNRGHQLPFLGWLVFKSDMTNKSRAIMGSRFNYNLVENELCIIIDFMILSSIEAFSGFFLSYFAYFCCI